MIPRVFVVSDSLTNKAVTRNKHLFNTICKIDDGLTVCSVIVKMVSIATKSLLSLPQPHEVTFHDALKRVQILEL
jgi:hypothetical protein